MNDHEAVGQELDSRERFLFRDDLHWRVTEHRWPTADRRSGTSLVFDADTVFRRVKRYPRDWYDLSDDALYALSLTT